MISHAKRLWPAESCFPPPLSLPSSWCRIRVLTSPEKETSAPLLLALCAPLPAFPPRRLLVLSESPAIAVQMLRASRKEVMVGVGGRERERGGERARGEKESPNAIKSIRSTPSVACHYTQTLK